MACLAKAYCSEAYFHSAAENIQIHGGIGFTWEHPAHLYFKRAKSSELLFGDPTYHRELLAQRLGIYGHPSRRDRPSPPGRARVSRIRPVDGPGPIVAPAPSRRERRDGCRHRNRPAGVDHQVGRELGDRAVGGPTRTDQHPADPRSRPSVVPDRRRRRRHRRLGVVGDDQSHHLEPGSHDDLGDSRIARTSAARGRASHSGPGTSARSTRVTRSVRAASARAAARPVGPAPITTAWVAPGPRVGASS